MKRRMKICDVRVRIELNIIIRRGQERMTIDLDQ